MFRYLIKTNYTRNAPRVHNQKTISKARQHASKLSVTLIDKKLNVSTVNYQSRRCCRFAFNTNEHDS